MPVAPRWLFSGASLISEDLRIDARFSLVSSAQIDANIACHIERFSHSPSVLTIAKTVLHPNLAPRSAVG
jgi:hypothetical protein